jgi:hypothetical protein
MTADIGSADAPQGHETWEARKVRRAFRLGWHFAQMYHDPHRARSDAGEELKQPPRHLPSLSELTVPERATLLMREIINDITCLDDELPADLKIPEVRASVVALDGVMKGPINAEGKRLQILQTYTRLRVDLGAADPHLGTALDLGRILADTVILPVTPADYRTEFNKFRLANVYGWLEDLHAYFPQYAADTVRGSLEIWQGWVSEHADSIAGDGHERARRALTMQGEKWRRILSAEILAEDLLTADDYRDAATFFLGRLRGLVWDFVKRFWPVALPLLLVTAGIVAAIVRWAPGGAASVVAVIAAAAGALGVSWKTVSSTLGKVAANAEQPLWNAEVQESIVMAATLLPTDASRREVMAMRRAAREAVEQPGKPAATGGAQTPADALPAAPAGPPATVPEPASVPVPAAGVPGPADGADSQPAPRA